jgi:integrase/recombinase XerD
MNKTRRGLPPKLHLPWEQWPVRDQELWQRAVADDDPFGDAAGARLSEATKTARWYGWRRFLGYVVKHDPKALSLSPAERLTMERVRTFADHLAETNQPHSVANQIDKLYGAAVIIMPDQDWAWLKRVKTRLYAAAPAHTKTGPITTSLPLLDLGLQLMDDNSPGPNERFRLADAVRYRDGLIIAFAAFAPLRRKNLAALQIGQHLVREGDEWIIIIRRSESKTAEPIEFELPEVFKPYLRVYLDIIRPRMLRGSKCDHLWVGYSGQALGYSAFWPITTRHTQRHLGFQISPHQFRDAGVTTWAIAKPEQIGVGRDLLGHRNLRTTRYYNRARGIEASRAYGGLIARLRKKSG